MKIIHKGELPEEKEYRCTCWKCGTIFEFLRKEARWPEDQRDVGMIEIDCPVCESCVQTKV